MLLSKKTRKKRRWAVHPINQLRCERGVFYTLFEELQEDNYKFFNYFRMSIASFHELAYMIRTNLKKDPRLLRGIALVPEEMLAITLR